MTLRRKKWTEAEERTLIEKYGEMVSDGTLSKMKTREKKFRPIASHVNSSHHGRDPVAFPWQWTWKDVSTKVQNMRHQYLLVKQKLKSPPAANHHDSGGGGGGGGGGEEQAFDWAEGVAHWSNFSRYKDVFGDFVGPAAAADGGFGFGDGEESRWSLRRRRRRRRRRKFPEGRREKEAEEREREWEEGRRRRREEWRERVEETMRRHREEMSQMQARVVHQQQSLVGQLLAVVSQWGPHNPAAMSDHASATNQYFSSHMMHGLVHDDARVEEDNHDDHFIVDA